MAFRIPELEAGVVGASTLNLYSNALNWLLGESHASYSVARMNSSFSTTETTASGQETRYLFHVTPLLYYAIALKIPNGQTATCTFYDEVAEAALGTVTSTSATWELKLGTIDISAHCTAAGYAVGDVLTIRVKLHTSSAGSAAQLYVFSFGERGVTTGWAPLPAFTDETQSDVADFNAVRTNLDILQDAMTSPVNGLMTDAARKNINTSDAWEDVCRMAYRYRGDALSVTVEGKGGGENGWQYRLISCPASNPTADTVLITGGWNAGTADYILDTDVIDMSAAGLTVGAWYMLRLQVQRDASPRCTIRRVWAIRTSAGTPLGSWVVPNQWAHGNTTINETQLTKWTTDLTELYTGGYEELWGDTPAILPAPGVAEGDREDRTFTGVHRKRWLIVKSHAGEDPILRYGTNMAETHSLSVDDSLTWQQYDLDTTEMPVGGYYAVTQCDVAFECDEVSNA